VIGRKGRWLCVIAAEALLAASGQAQGEVHTGGPAVFDPGPLPVAATVREGPDGQADRLVRSIVEIVIADLERATVAKLVFPIAVEAGRDFDKQTPDFQILRQKMVQEFLEARAEPGDEGRPQLRLRLWDVLAGQPMFTEAMPVDAEDWRHTGHLVANDVYERTTGSSVRFDAPVLFTTSVDKADPRLVVMDWDGWNARFLTGTREAASPPRVGYDGTIFGVTRSGDAQRLYRFEPHGRRWAVPGDFSRLTGTPSPSPNGHTIVLSRAGGPYANLYLLDLQTQAETRLSDGSWMDTAASYAPDGQNIAFVSNRGGTPQLYVTKADGSAPRRISFGAGQYVAVAWSPDPRLLSFVKAIPEAVPSDGSAHSRFAVGTVRDDGSGERILGEFPTLPELSWMPGGEVLFVAVGAVTGGEKKALLTTFSFAGYGHKFERRQDLWTDLSSATTAVQPR
jgi:TolB protein